MFKIKSFALAFGTVWGLGQLIIGWFAASGWGYEYIDVMSSLYLGYDATFFGGIIGGIWGFVVGAIVGGAFAYLYDVFSGKIKISQTPKKRRK
jgi:hypothetical protein